MNSTWRVSTVYFVKETTYAVDISMLNFESTARVPGVVEP